VLVIHRTADYLRHPACTELSRRGFMVLCMNTRFTNNEMLVRFEEFALDVKAGVQFLRTQPGATLVQWFGVSAANILPIFPSLANFTTQNLGFLTTADRLPRLRITSYPVLPLRDGLVHSYSGPGRNPR
jgi:hypothetical protein